MLGDYFQGTLPQTIERARILKGKISRKLPRDYDALVRTSETELDSIITRLRSLQKVSESVGPAVHRALLRQFKRAVADLDHIETRAITVLDRAHKDDHRANRLLYAICQEINYPALTPTVTTLSTAYFYIDTKLNLMFIPPAEGSFLLHLPDMYHELGHPLLTQKDHPLLDNLRKQYLMSMTRVHDYFARQREVETARRGPRAFKDQIDLWELLWSKYWLEEFYCDLFAASTLGPAFAWSHLHLYLKMGGNAFAIPDGISYISHPADDARMRAILEALGRSGFSKDTIEITGRWREALALTTDSPEPEYVHCYPEELLSAVVEDAVKGVTETECRLARPETSDPIHLMLNGAWRNFWSDPASYHRWEAEAVQELFSPCGETAAKA